MPAELPSLLLSSKTRGGKMILQKGSLIETAYKPGCYWALLGTAIVYEN